MKGKRKIISLIFVLVFMAVFIQGCAQRGCEAPTEYAVEEGIILLDKEGTISCELCKERGLDSKIVVLESKYCGACQAAVPILKEVEEESGAELLFLDLSEEEDSAKMNDLKVQPFYTPTLLVGCDVYIGVKSKEAYKKIISDFLG